MSYKLTYATMFDPPADLHARFDAALAGFDAGHVVLSYGDGDPWRFFAAFNTLGRIRIDAVEEPGVAP